MKIVAVSDHFIRKEDYERAFAKMQNVDLKTVFYGYEDRIKMRDIFSLVEKNGPDAYPAPQEVYDEIEDADMLMVHICPVPRKLIEKAKKLKVIFVNRGGLENIDLKACAEKGIQVFNNPAHNANAVAEYTVGAIITETRNICRSFIGLKNNEWLEQYPNFGNIYELKGKTVGIIGFSNIGRLVAKKLSAFGCKFLINDIKIDPDDEDMKRLGAKAVDLSTLLKESDIVSIHARCNSVIMTKEMFSYMKPTAYFINTARAHMVDYDALYDVLKNKKIMGAFIDVFYSEPLPVDFPLLTLDNVTLSSHRAGDTINAYSDSPEMMIDDYLEYLNGKKPRFLVNFNK